LLRGDPAGAEQAYIASLDWARQQQAKSGERTATSYARLLLDQGRTREACELLAPIYAWFTEGFAMKDLKDAKALLDEPETAGALVPAARLTRGSALRPSPPGSILLVHDRASSWPSPAMNWGACLRSDRRRRLRAWRRSS
jgi:hypothetical protein